MKILFVAAHLGGGAGKAISGMAALCGKRFDVETILLEAPQEMKYVRVLQESGIPWSVASNEREAADAVARSDITILNWWNHPLTIRFLLDVRRVRCRMIIWNHINGCYYPLLPAAFLNLFSHVLFTSPVSFENEGWSDAERGQIMSRSSIVYGMGDFRPWETAKKTDYVIRDERFTIGYVGTISYEKIHRDFIGFCAAAARVVPHVECKMVGRLGPAFLEEVRGSGFEDLFSLAGFLENPRESYLSFDIFGYLLRPESYATTENVLLEAMAHGLPIIVLNNPVERHIIQDGVNGFLVNDKEEYASKVFDLYRSESMRSRIGGKAREYVMDQYNPHANFLCFCQSIERAMDAPRGVVDVEALFRDGFGAFCYFSGMDQSTLEADIRAGHCPAPEHLLAGTGESKAGIAQYCRYFPHEERLGCLLEAAEIVRRSGGE